MSFSGDVKRELVEILPSSRHCQIAELAALIRFLGDGTDQEDRSAALSIRTDREDTANLVFTLMRKAFNMDLVLSPKERGKRGRDLYGLSASPGEGRIGDVRKALGHSSLLRLPCCRQAFLRGAFLGAGSVSDPEKSYHLEIVCPEEESAELVRDTMRGIGLDARIVLRKKNHVVYLKEGDQIVSLLGAMGGSISFLNLESVRVLKEMRGSVNRIVNCETANLNKTIVSAVRQIEDIRFIRDNGGFGDLPESLREMAEIRLQYPDAPLTELGTYLDPVLGKSGVNHRLRKLSSIAQKRRGELRRERECAEEDDV